MKKRILLIGYNFFPELTGIGKYSGEMMHWLALNGYDCTVITAYPYYPYWKVQEPYFRNRFMYKTENKRFESGGKLTVYRCPMYIPAQPTGIKRILLDFSFLLSAALKLIQLIPGQKFDSVITIAPSFQFGLLGILYKKFRNTKVLYHVQDMQIEAARDLKLIKSKKIINLLFRTEKYVFDNSDIVSSISQGMISRLEAKAKKSVLLFPNWTDIDLFYPIHDRATLKEGFGFNAADKIILYSGAIGEKQGLEAIVHAANEYKLYDSLVFVICGSGPYKQKLQELAARLDVQNINFFPLQPFDKFNQFLNMADVHLVIQKANASDLVMPSKLTTILAVGGLALITANEDSSLYALVHQHRMGLLVEAESQVALNEGIKRAISADTSIMTVNARVYAEENLSIESVMGAFKRSIDI